MAQDEIESRDQAIQELAALVFELYNNISCKTKNYKSVNDQ